MKDEDTAMKSVVGATIIDFHEGAEGYENEMSMFRTWTLKTTKGNILIVAEDGGYIERM